VVAASSTCSRCLPTPWTTAALWALC